METHDVKREKFNEVDLKVKEYLSASVKENWRERLTIILKSEQFKDEFLEVTALKEELKNPEDFDIQQYVLMCNRYLNVSRDLIRRASISMLTT